MKEDKAITVAKVAAVLSICVGIIGAFSLPIHSASILGVLGVCLGALIPSSLIIFIHWDKFVDSKSDDPLEGLGLPIAIAFTSIPGIFAGMIVIVIRESLLN